MSEVKEKNLVLCIVLSLVTFGIYGIVWFIQMNSDIKAITKDEWFNGGKNFLLTLVTCGIWGMYWAYKAGKADAQISGGNDNAVLYLILTLFGLGIVVYCLVQNDINKYAQAHGGSAPAATA